MENENRKQGHTVSKNTRTMNFINFLGSGFKTNGSKEIDRQTVEMTGTE